MPDFLQKMSDAPDLSTKEQKQMGKAQAGKISADHMQFLQKILSLIDTGAIDPIRPETFIDQDKYKTLPQEGKAKVDASLINIASQLQHVTEFHRSKHTPDESPQLETMISHLTDMLERLDGVRSVFIF